MTSSRWPRRPRASLRSFRRGRRETRFIICWFERSPAAGPAHVVLVAETSAAMTAVDRVHQRAAIEAVLGALPPTSKVTLLAADWEVSVIADEVDPADVRQALDKLDGITSAGVLHLQRTLADAAARARRRAGTAVLFIGGGLDGFGGDAIREPLRQLRDAGARLSVVTTSDVPPALADAAALTGGEALRAATLDGELGALVDALRARPSPPTLAARGTRLARARDRDRTDGLGGTRARGPSTASRGGTGRSFGGRNGPDAALGSCAPRLV